MQPFNLRAGKSLGISATVAFTAPLHCTLHYTTNGNKLADALVFQIPAQTSANTVVYPTLNIPFDEIWRVTEFTLYNANTGNLVIQLHLKDDSTNVVAVMSRKTVNASTSFNLSQF